MTYNEAYERTQIMEPMCGMHITIVKGNPESENSYYPDYKHNNTMGGMSMWHFNETRMIRDMWDRDQYFAIDGKVNAGEAPAGRSQKSHNLIQAMNQKGKRY